MEATQIVFYMTCLCLARDLVSCDDYEETGKDITFTPRIRGNPAEILWKHNGNKVLDYDGSELVAYGSFRGRVVVDFETGELTIRKLTSQDSGQYQCDILINGNVQTSSHTVTVLDALPEPQVTCELVDSSNASKILSCSVESRTQPSYEWSGPNINVQSGPRLLVNDQEEKRDSVYTCTVKNQANSKSADFTLKDCPIGRAGSAVLAPVLIVTILLLILLILLALFLYRWKKQTQARLSEPNKMDPEIGENQNLLKKNPTDVITGPSDATLPSHNRLPPQKESIANKKWEQDNGSENSVEEEKEKLLKETKTFKEHSPIQSLRSVSETKQEDKEHGHEGELDKNEKNSESAGEAEENTHSKPDETEKESHKPLQSQEEEEKENIQIQKEESGDEEKSPEHQNETLEELKTDNNEDNQTPGATEEAIDRRDTGEDQNLLRKDPTDVMTGSSDTTLPREHEPLQSQEEEEKENIQMQKEESGDEEKSPEHQNETLEELKTDNNEDNQTPGATEEAIDRRDTGEDQNLLRKDPTDVMTGSSDATLPREHEPLQSQEEEEKENIQIQKEESGDEEKSPEHQNETLEELKTDNNEDNQTPGATEEAIDRRDTETETLSPQSAVTERNNMDTEKEEGPLNENEKKSQSDDGEQSPEQPNENEQKTAADSEDNMRPAADQPLDGEAPSAPMDSPAHLEKEPTNSSASSSNQTDLSNHTDQVKEEERKGPGLEQDVVETAVTNQEQKDGQEQMAEDKDHDPERSEGKSSMDFNKQDKQADPDSPKNSVSQRDEAVKSEKSEMTDKDQSCELIDDKAKVVEGETEVQTQQEDGGQRDMSNEPEQDMEEKKPPEMSQK